MSDYFLLGAEEDATQESTVAWVIDKGIDYPKA